MRSDAEDASPVKTNTKQKISQFFNTFLVPSSTTEAFSSEADFTRYKTYFHRREIIFDRRFSLLCLSTTGLKFTELLHKSGLSSLALVK